jgi:hypothetical protein
LCIEEDDMLSQMGDFEDASEIAEVVLSIRGY